MSALKRTVLLAAFFAFDSLIAFAQHNFPPTDDSYVGQNDCVTNYGTDQRLRTRNRFGGGGSEHWEVDTAIKFKLWSIPQGTTIISARLNLYYYANWDNNPIGRNLPLYRLLSDWGEDTLTWCNLPERAPTESASSVVPRSFGWMSWDVTADVQDFVNRSSPNYGWFLTDPVPYSNYNIPQTWWYSKEHADHRPYLEVVIAGDNRAPVAEAGDTYGGSVGQSMTFDASQSHDPDPGDYIAGYRWDWNNDGTWDTGWLENPVIMYSYDSTYHGQLKLEVRDSHDATGIDSARVDISVVSGTQVPDEQIVTDYSLMQNFPNPFNAVTTILFDLPNAGYISLCLFDALGREVAVLEEDNLQAGSHRVTFDGSNLATGMYFCRLRSGSFADTKKMLLVK